MSPKAVVGGGDQLEDNLILDIGNNQTSYETTSKRKKKQSKNAGKASGVEPTLDTKNSRLLGEQSNKRVKSTRDGHDGLTDHSSKHSFAKDSHNLQVKKSTKLPKEEVYENLLAYINEEFFNEKKFAQVQRVEKQFSENNLLDNFTGPHNTDNLTNYIKMIVPDWQRKLKASESTEKGAPLIIVICSSAIRAVELLKVLSEFNALARIGKLFAKHFKVQEQIEFLERTPVRIVVGTPNRLSKLIEEGALKMHLLQAIVIDCVRDKKEMTCFEINDVRRDLFDFLDRHGLPWIKQKTQCRLGLY